jgi:hypothetical protein
MRPSAPPATAPDWRRPIIAATGRAPTAEAVLPSAPGVFRDITEVAFVSHTSGCFLSASREDRLYALTGIAAESERITVVPLSPPGAQYTAAQPPGYALMTASAQLIAVHGDTITADDDALTDASRFHIVPIGDGRVWLRQGAATFLTVRADGAVVAKSDPADEAATWWPLRRLVLGQVMRKYAMELSGTQVALWCPAARGWLSATPLGPLGITGGDVSSGCRKLAYWEVFTLIVVDASESTVALRSSHGTLLSAHPDGRFAANKREVGVWETLRLLEDETGRVALRTSHGTFVSARDPGRVDAVGPYAGESELWVLLAGEVAKRRYWDSDPTVRESLERERQLGNAPPGSGGGGGAGLAGVAGGAGARVAARAAAVQAAAAARLATVGSRVLGAAAEVRTAITSFVSPPQAVAAEAGPAAATPAAGAGSSTS